MADNRYEFTFELPSTLATHDWHPEGTIRQELYAEIEGIPTSHFSFFHRAQSPSARSASKSRRHQSPAASASASRHQSPTSTREQSPGGVIPGELSFLSSFREPPTISLVQQVNSLPPVPTYEQSQSQSQHDLTTLRGNGDEHDGSWLEGTFKVTRAVKLVYNPHPMGGINALDERTQGLAPGLGPYELMFHAPVVSPSH
jgi:hypothetical protein